MNKIHHIEEYMSLNHFDLQITRCPRLWEPITHLHKADEDVQEQEYLSVVFKTQLILGKTVLLKFDHVSFIIMVVNEVLSKLNY